MTICGARMESINQCVFCTYMSCWKKWIVDPMGLGFIVYWQWLSVLCIDIDHSPLSASLHGPPHALQKIVVFG